jgi:hypothetical protein
MDPAAVVRFFDANGDKKLSKDEFPEPVGFLSGMSPAGRTWPGCPKTGVEAGLY